MVNHEKFRLSFTELKLKGNLGKGGQGTVTQAEWRGRRVAVKKYNNGQHPDIELVAKLNHRNIIRLLGVCSDSPCIVMELCQRTLNEVIESERLITFEEFLDWSIQIAEGMEYLHSENVTHRDLKPMNVLFGLDDGIKVSDFDLSKHSADGVLKSRMTTFCGTMQYIAPEIWDKGYSHKIDIWSFGILIWEVLTQQEPYAGIQNFAIRLVTNQIRLPVPMEIPPQLYDMLTRCLSRDPSGRPEFTEIRDILQSTSNFDESEWSTLKTQWRTTPFDYAIDPSANSSITMMSTSNSSNVSLTSTNGSSMLTINRSTVTSQSSGDDAPQLISPTGNQSIELEQMTSTRPMYPVPIASAIRQTRSQEVRSRVRLMRIARRKYSRTEIPKDSNEGRTCRNRVHIYTQYGGCSCCDLCDFAGRAICQLICHAKCIIRAPNPCIPRPAHLTDYRTFEEFDAEDKLQYLPSTRPQIFHHVLACILDLERRNEAHEWSLSASEVWLRANEVFLTFFNSRKTVALQNESAQTLRCVIQRFHLELLPRTEQHCLIDAIRRVSLHDMKQFIVQLPAVRRCSAALFFSHLKRHLTRNRISNISDWLTWALLNDWIGVNVPWDNIHAVKKLLKEIELEFWDAMLAC